MASPRSRRVLGIGELGRRLILAFVGVALVATAAEVLSATITAGADIQQFVGAQESEQATAAARAAGTAYLGHGHWDTARLRQIIGVIGGTAATAAVRNLTGAVIQSSPLYARFPARPDASAPVDARGRRVGSISLRFDHVGLGAAAARLEAERWKARLYATVIGVAVALLVSVAITRRITAPLERMLTAMYERAAGNRSARIKDVRGVGVLHELLEGFNRATDALDQRDRAQRNLVANVAHELRTPVAILQAGHEAMLDGVTPATPENLGSLHDEVLRLSRLMDDLQRLAAAEAAALQLRLAPYDLASVAGETVASLSERFRLAGLELEPQLAEVPVSCDRDRMREIVMNLLTNAMKYTPAGGRVVIATGPEGRHGARLVVRDSGIGIPADELPRVTERFFRGKRSQELAAGTGFGLTIVGELVRAHNGALDITSEPGIGTRVTVTFPQARTAPGTTRRWRAAG
ncbi:MAG: sensor histidine kinase [Streptosporangiaceae bacterium]